MEPYIIGKANNTYSNAGNDVKALQTHSGNKLILNDAEGSVHLTDKGPAELKFDGQGKANMNAAKVITINGNEEIHLICGESSIHLYKDGTIVINDKEIFADGQTSVSVTSGENSSVVIQPTTLEADSNSVTVTGKSDVSVGGNKNWY